MDHLQALYWVCPAGLLAVGAQATVKTFRVLPQKSERPPHSYCPPRFPRRPSRRSAQAP